MMTTDPIADMLSRIRNAQMVRHSAVTMPSSRLREALARVLTEEGYVARYEVLRDQKFPTLLIQLKYTEDREPIIRGMERVSKPGCRIYTKREDIPWVKAGMGTVILSTPRGVVSGRQARGLGVGGEVLCKVW
ncbi:MAG: 30S ribosomal protein S8 [Anaerolineae bacterium]